MSTVARIESLLRRRSVARLQKSVGQSLGFDQLEQRIVLDAVPGLADGFNNAQLIALNGAGVGTFADPINEIGDDDLFRIDLTSLDFVRILADADKGAGQTAQQFADRVDTRIELYDADGLLVQTATNSGNLTPAVDPTEAFIGFVPDADDFVGGTATYFIRVLSDQMAGETATGGYTIRVNAL